MKKNGQINRLKTFKGPDITAPFGYCTNGTRYGRNFTLVLENSEVDQFLELIINKLK